MLPIGDDNSTRKTFPFVTYALIAVNVVFFLIELVGGDAFAAGTLYGLHEGRDIKECLMMATCAAASSRRKSS